MRQFLYPLEKTVKRHGQSVQKVATVATFVATLQGMSDVGCRRCRHCSSHDHGKIRSYNVAALEK